MPKPKPPKKPVPSPAEQDETTHAPPPLVYNATEQDFLARGLKFLVNIQTAPFAARALREGYTTEEHRIGWKLFKLASGESRPLDHLFAESAGAGAIEGAERLRFLQDVDAFENTWFPRTRAIIQRVVPRDRRDAFEAAFFQNLEQQPLGPGVIVSVSTFLSRLDGLATSADPDAKLVLPMLQKRGLTEGKVKEVRGLLHKLEAGGGTPDKPKVSAAEIAKRSRSSARRSRICATGSTTGPRRSGRCSM